MTDQEQVSRAQQNLRRVQSVYATRFSEAKRTIYEIVEAYEFSDDQLNELSEIILAHKMDEYERIEMPPRTKITLPATIEEAASALAEIDSLLTAKEWHRAAIVAAFVVISESCAHHAKTSMRRETPLQFAARGLVGLRSKDTVRRYAQAWQSAVDRGKAKAVSPGDTVLLPALDWPPKPTSRQSAAEPEREAQSASEPVATSLVGYEAARRQKQADQFMVGMRAAMEEMLDNFPKVIESHADISAYIPGIRELYEQLGKILETAELPYEEEEAEEEEA